MKPEVYFCPKRRDPMHATHGNKRLILLENKNAS